MEEAGYNITNKEFKQISMQVGHTCPTIAFGCAYQDKKCKYMDSFVTEIGHFGLFDSRNFRPHENR